MRNTHCLFLVIDLADGANICCNFFKIFFNLFTERWMYDEPDVVYFLRANSRNVLNKPMNDRFSRNREKGFCSSKRMRSEPFTQAGHRYNDVHVIDLLK